MRPTDDVTREILTKIPQMQLALDKAARDMNNVDLSPLKQVFDKAAIAMGIDPDDVPTPPALDISEEVRDWLWQMIEEHAWHHHRVLSAWNRDEFNRRTSEEEKQRIALRSVLGFEGE